MNSAKFLALDSRAPTTSLRQPKELCAFSRTFEGEYVNDDSSLGYYFLPDSEIDTNIDLGVGFNKFKKFDEARDGEFVGLLSAIQEYEKQSDKKVKADIITWRGIMTKLLTLPYNQPDPIELNAVYYDGHIFIQQEKQPEEQHPEHLQKLMYSGYKFESMATLPKPLAQVSRAAIDKRSKKIVNNIEQYCSIVKTGVGKKRIIIGGEVDCVWDYKPEDRNPLPHYVELKTSKVISQPNHTVTFEKKLFRTWAQTFLLGINKIIYGFRDDDLILRSVEEYKTEEIPVLLKSNPLNTNPHKINCMDALKWYGAVVDFIVDNIPQDETKAWRISYDPKVKTFSLFEAFPDKAEKLLNNGILTESFKEWRESRKSKKAKKAKKDKE